MKNTSRIADLSYDDLGLTAGVTRSYYVEKGHHEFLKQVGSPLQVGASDVLRKALDMIKSDEALLSRLNDLLVQDVAQVRPAALASIGTRRRKAK